MQTEPSAKAFQSIYIRGRILGSCFLAYWEYFCNSMSLLQQHLCLPRCRFVSQVRKGMVLVDERLKPAASWEFDADVAILTHSTTIQPRYQAVVHCEIIRQAARVVAMDRERELISKQ